jgi:hypothetical protein
MTDRTDTIPLAASEPRCSSDACVVAHRCARRRAAMPARGAIVSDFSISSTGGGSALCLHFYDVNVLRMEAAKDKAQPVQRRVFPPIGGAR